MPINVTHGSPYQTGLNLPRQRRQPNRGVLALGVWETMQRRQQDQQRLALDFSYRDAMLRQQQQEFWAEAPQMVDPAAQAQATARAAGGRFGSGSSDQVSAALGARQVQAQQRANARARRMGKQIPYPDAEPHMTAGVTRVDARRAEDREQELEDWDRRRDEQLGDEERRREWMQEDRTEQGRVTEWRGRADALQQEVDQMIQQAGGATALTPAGQQAYESLQNDLAALDRDQDAQGPNQMTPIEYHRARAQRIQQFRNQWNPTQHVTPQEQRPGSVTTDQETGIRYKRTPEGGQEAVGLVDEPMPTPEQIRRGESRNWRYVPGTDILQQRKLGPKGMVDWETVGGGTAKDKITEYATRAKALTEYFARKEGAGTDPSEWTPAQKEAIYSAVEGALGAPPWDQEQPGQPPAGGTERPIPQPGDVPTAGGRRPRTPEETTPLGTAGPGTAEQPAQPPIRPQPLRISPEQSIDLAESPLGQKTIKEALEGNAEMEKTLNELGITVVRGPDDMSKVPVGGVFVAPDGSVRTRKV